MQVEKQFSRPKKKVPKPIRVELDDGRIQMEDGRIVSREEFRAIRIARGEIPVNRPMYNVPTYSPPTRSEPTTTSGVKLVTTAKAFVRNKKPTEEMTLKNELMQIAKWSENETFEILVNEYTFKPNLIYSKIMERKDIAIIVEDVEGNRYGGFIHAHIPKINDFVQDANAFTFVLEREHKANYERFPIKEGTDVEGIVYADTAFYLSDTKNDNKVLFQFGFGDLMVYMRERKFYVSRTPFSYEYPPEVESEMAVEEPIQLNRIHVVHFRGKNVGEHKLYITGVPTSLSNEAIKRVIRSRLYEDDIRSIQINKDERETCAVYLSMNDQASAKDAIDKLNRFNIEGHTISATWFYANGPSAKYKKLNLYINMPEAKRLHITERQFNAFFSRFGKIESSKFLGTYGFVQYVSPEAVQQVLQLNEKDTIELGKLQVSYKKKR